MSLGIFLAVLLAAFLHASWNALIRVDGVNKLTSMLTLSLGQGVIGGLVALTRPFPLAESWPWLLGSGLIHMAYLFFLALAYQYGDLSRVYPIARGTAPMIVVVVGAVFLGETLSTMEYIGVITVGLGVLLMARGVFTSGEDRKLLPFAIGAAAATAAYTMTDAVGARLSGDPAGYVGWLLLLASVLYIPAMTLTHGTAILRAPWRIWGLGIVSGVAAYGSYALAIWATTHAPIALVAALRETSILFAVLLGWLVFREGMDRWKAIAAVAIVSGVVLTRL